MNKKLTNNLKLLKPGSPFSKPHLLLFALVFATLGGYALYRTFAAETVVATLEAEQMVLPPGASAVYTIGASAGKAAKLTANGTATASVSLPANTTSVTLKAYSRSCYSSYPTVNLSIDNTLVMSRKVSSRTWASHSAAKELTAGLHTVSLTASNVNRYGCNGAALYLDVLTFSGNSAPPTPGPTISFSASPSSVSAGNSSTLTWNSTNANSCMASGAWSGSKPLSGSASTGALNTTAIYNLTCSGTGGNASASVTVSVSAATPPPAPPPTPPPSGGVMGEMFITKAELMAKPMSGAGWTFLKSKADMVSYGTVNLADQQSMTQTYVLAGALVYARTGDVNYKNKVITHLKQVCGTETDGSDQLLNLARTLYGYVVSADLVQMPHSTACNNGQTWQTFLQNIRTYVICCNGRWPTIEKTSGDTASNWGAYSLASHLAVSYALNDTAAIQRDIDIFKRYLGDTTSPAKAFVPTASYDFNGNGATWDMTPLLKRGINPYSATDGRNGAMIEDAMRYTGGGSDSVPCCTVPDSGVTYMEEGMDGFLSTAQLLRAHGINLASFQDNAMRRAFDFYIRNGGPGPFGVSQYLPYVINYWYGTSYPTAAETQVYRHMGYGAWLFK